MEDVEDSSSTTTTAVFPEGTVVVFVSTLWPEPHASAAGVRTRALLQGLAQAPGVHRLYYLSAAAAPPSHPNDNDNDNNNIQTTTTSTTTRSVDEARWATQQELHHVHGIEFVHMAPNQSTAMQAWMNQHLPRVTTTSSRTGTEPPPPSSVVIVFDRFYAEEMYSFHFYQHFFGTTTPTAARNETEQEGSSPSSSPKVLMVLDMQDWHSLRALRQGLVEQPPPHGNDAKNNHTNDPTPLVSSTMLHQRPTASDPLWLRELASLHRCDVTLVCSPWETHQLVSKSFGVSPQKVCTAPLLQVPAALSGTTTSSARGAPTENHKNKNQTRPAFPLAHEHTATTTTRNGESSFGLSSFHGRQDLCFVGNFRHAPNVDAIHLLEHVVWPRLAPHLPHQVQLHIYGAHVRRRRRRRPVVNRRYKQAHQQQEDYQDRIQWHGYCPDLSHVLTGSRLLVAPLRFGAGLKGKIVEAWKHGLPVVTTSIGSEGLGMVDHSDHDDNNDNHNDDDTMDSDGCQSNPLPTRSIDLSSFGGGVADTVDDFVATVVDLYTNEVAWTRAQDCIPPLLDRLEQFDQAVVPTLARALHQSPKRQQDDDAMRALLWHSSHERTKYFSKYIECKTELKQVQDELHRWKEQQVQEEVSNNSSEPPKHKR